MHEAAMAALEEKLRSTYNSSDASISTIKTSHFELALGKISPSVSEKVGLIFFQVLFYYLAYKMPIVLTNISIF